MSNVPSTIKSLVTTHKQDHLADQIPSELLTEYNDRKKALKVTEASILAVLKENSPLAKLGTNNRTSLIEVNGATHARFDFQITVEGHVVKDTPNRVNIDYTTLNLLLNNKILTPSEKKRLLRLQGLLPDHILDENQAIKAEPKGDK